MAHRSPVLRHWARPHQWRWWLRFPYCWTYERPAVSPHWHKSAQEKDLIKFTLRHKHGHKKHFLYLYFIYRVCFEKATLFTNCLKITFYILSFTLSLLTSHLLIEWISLLLINQLINLFIYYYFILFSCTYLLPSMKMFLYIWLLLNVNIFWTLISPVFI